MRVLKRNQFEILALSKFRISIKFIFIIETKNFFDKNPHFEGMMIVRWSSSSLLVLLISLSRLVLTTSTFETDLPLPSFIAEEIPVPIIEPLTTLEEILTPLISTTFEDSTTILLDLPASVTESSTVVDPIATAIAEESIIDSGSLNPPEFLSFNEWREKYTALSDSNGKGQVKKGKKLMKSKSEGNLMGTTVEGDGTENGSLFSQELLDHIPYEPMVEGWSQEGVVAERENLQPELISSELSTSDLDIDPSSRYPLQPLPLAGSGELTDPLLLLKDRTNYALSDCAAKVHRSSPQSKGASSILVEKKDRYMLTPCAATSKFVELELCDEIRIDTIVLANFEFFSSMFKHFSIKVSMHYPGRPDEWHDLGTFRARNARGVQVSSTIISISS